MKVAAIILLGLAAGIQAGTYLDRFKEQYEKIHNSANGYFSKEGVPYHAIETLVVSPGSILPFESNAEINRWKPPIMDTKQPPKPTLTTCGWRPSTAMWLGISPLSTPPLRTWRPTSSPPSSLRWAGTTPAPLPPMPMKRTRPRSTPLLWSREFQ